jgi:hypothetical protein
METSASSGQSKGLFHRKSIATIDAIEHVLNVANSYFAYSVSVQPVAGKSFYSIPLPNAFIIIMSSLLGQQAFVIDHT